jgi:hypothetical protein
MPSTAVAPALPQRAGVPLASLEAKVGVVTADRAATEALMKSARGSFKFVALDASAAVSPGLRLDAIILVFGEPAEASVRFFAECIEAVPHIPVLGVSSLDSSHVVELLKCGMSDHLTPPIDSDLLQRKLVRMIRHDPGTVLDSALLEPLPRAPPPAKPSQRKCSRAAVPMGATARVIFPDAGVSFRLTDLSIPTLEAPGGLGLEADTATTASVSKWNQKAVITIQIEVPPYISAEPIPARGRIIRAVSLGKVSHIGMQFWLDRMRDEALLQRFWIKGQAAQRSRGAGR